MPRGDRGERQEGSGKSLLDGHVSLPASMLLGLGGGVREDIVRPRLNHLEIKEDSERIFKIKMCHNKRTENVYVLEKIHENV